ncbi:MAG: ATP-binding protein, partial [Puniceicoccales bacterium]
DLALSFYSDEHRDRLQAALTSCLESAIPYDLTVQINDNRGKQKWCRIEGAPLWSNGELVGAWGLIQDVTEVRQQSLELQDALNKANLANQAKNQFLMMMSHELRTPLNPILGFTDLMIQEEQNPEKRDYLQQIHMSASHLVNLIGEILDLSSIEAGHMTLESKPFPLVQTIQDAVEILRPSIEAKGLDLVFDHSNQNQYPSPLICLGDPGKLRQIILNLLNNALKFTEKGEITVQFPPPEIGEDNVNFRIIIKDTGIGIDENELDRIFSKFYQVNKGATRKYEGQGIGLFLCRELAKLMNGTITAESRPEHGTTFTLNLSLQRIPEEVPATPPAPKINTGARKVLIVEDDPMNGLMLGKLLDSLKIPNQLACNGFEALKILSHENFSLVLMDLQMPILNGIETTQKIREGGFGNQDIQIVAISAHVLEKIKNDALAAGMNGFLEKPINRNKLIAMMDNLERPQESTE